MTNIGLGGTLTFNAGPAMHGMQQAASGFEHLDHAREKFQHNLHSLGESFEHFNLMAAGFGVAGVAGLHQLIHSSFEAASEQEQAQIQIGTNLGIARGKGFKHGLALAKQEIEKLEDIGVETGANQEGIFGIYKSLSLPLSQAGASMAQLRDFTKQTAVMAMATGTSFDEMGGDIQRFLAGFVRDRDPLFRQLKMAGLVRADMAAEELQTMTAQQRMKLVGQVLGRYAEGAATVTTSWKAVGQSISNVISKIKESFIGMEGGLFSQVKQDIQGVIKYFQQHKEHVLEVAANIGTYLVPIYRVLKAAVIDIVMGSVRIIQTLAEWAEKGSKVMGFLGVSSDTMFKIAKYAAMFAMVIGTLIPMLSLFSSIMGPGAALIKTALSGFSLLLSGLMTFALPLVAVIAVLAIAFAALRKDGEGFGQTMVRIWTDYIKPAWEGLSSTFMGLWSEIFEPLKVGFDMVKEAVLFLMDYLSDTFTGGATSAQGFGTTLGTVVAAITQVITTAIGAFAKLLAGAMYAIAWIIYGFKQIGKYVGEAMGMAVLGVSNLFKDLLNIMTAPFRAILDFVSGIVEQIASTSFGQKALKLVGLDPAEVTRSAREVAAFSEQLRAKYEGIAGFSSPDETPDEEVLRKREARLNQPKDQNIKVDAHATVHIDNKLVVDGKVVAQAQAAHQVEISERAGAKTSPWQRRASLVRQQPIASAGAK